MFQGERLRLARDYRGSTLDALGRQIFASRQFIQQLEVGTRQPSEQNIGAISEALDFPTNFFLRPVDHKVVEDDCNFRSRRTTRQSLRRRVATYATLLQEVINYLEQYVYLPGLRLPRGKAETQKEIEELAQLCRATWGIPPDEPIDNMTRALENAGVIVSEFGGITDKIDALSVASVTSVVIRNTAKQSSSRARFDLAHECGHLVMHFPLESGSPESERAADAFASALLMPEKAFRKEFPSGGFRWPALFALKQRWGASVAAIVHRALDLQLIGPLEYRRANVSIRRRGWHKGEPREPDEERPELLQAAFMEVERSFHSSAADVARELGLTEDVMRSLVST